MSHFPINNLPYELIAHTLSFSDKSFSARVCTLWYSLTNEKDRTYRFSDISNRKLLEYICDTYPEELVYSLTNENSDYKLWGEIPSKHFLKYLFKRYELKFIFSEESFGPCFSEGIRCITTGRPQHKRLDHIFEEVCKGESFDNIEWFVERKSRLRTYIPNLAIKNGSLNVFKWCTEILEPPSELSILNIEPSIKYHQIEMCKIAYEKTFQDPFLQNDIARVYTMMYFIEAVEARDLEIIKCLYMEAKPKPHFEKNTLISRAQLLGYTEIVEWIQNNTE